jgi:hypothetical protein
MRSLVLVACLAAACGEDSSGGPYVPLDMIASSYKAAMCHHLTACGSFPDEPTCLAANVPDNFTIDGNTIAAVLDGKVYYDGGKLAACFDAIAAATCDRTDEDGRTTPASCSNLFRGTLGAGDTCAFDLECTSDACATSGVCELACCTGTCIGDTPPPPRLAQVGESCGFGSLACVANAYCDTTGICAPLKTINTACNSQNECDFGLACIGTPTMTCRALPPTGQPCPDFACRDEGDYCNSTTQVCTKVGLPGTACSFDGECSAYYHCDSTIAQCSAYPALGESCALIGRCNDAGAYCDGTTGTCLAAGADGAACTSGAQCLSLFCDPSFNICATPPACD